MANEKQLYILEEGVAAWNEWRDRNLGVKVDLEEADFSYANLSEVNLLGANLRKADFRNADLRVADLSEADLSEGNFRGAYLVGAKISSATIFETDLSRARLGSADLTASNLSNVNLCDAGLVGTHLIRTIINQTVLTGCDFSNARAFHTFFTNLDMSEVIGLDTVEHGGPSTIGFDTIAKSKGKISEPFLRGCGLSDWEIEFVKLYNTDLHNDEFIDIQNKIFELRNRQALQISPLFISYSHDDNTFVDKLEAQLNAKGVRFWRDSHDLKAGRIEKQIDRAISQNQTVLLILSKNSLKSDWVEHEVRTARELEKGMGRDVLCPVTLDDSWKSSRWPKRVMEQIMEYNILDFSAWEDDVKFDGIFRKLIDGLELFYKG